MSKRFFSALTTVAAAVQLVVAAKALRFASAIQRGCTTLAAVNGAQTRLRSRDPILIGSGDRSDMVIGFMNWFNGSPYTVTKVSVEGPNGVVVPVTFSGGRAGTVPANAGEYLSDPILPSQFGLTKFTVGEVYLLNVDAPLPLMRRAKPSGAGGLGSFAAKYNPSTVTVKDVDVAGSVTWTGSDISGDNTGTPAFFTLGRFVGSEAPVWFGVGDSIMYGQGANQDTNWQNGWFERGMYDANATSNPTANFCQGVSGLDATNFISSWMPVISPLFKYANRFLDEFGTNDFSSSGTVATTAQVLTRKRQIWAAAVAAGVSQSRVYSTLLLPYTTSTDSWATEVNQAYKGAGWAPGGNVEQLNTALSGLVGTELGGVVLFSAALGVDPRKWITNGTANFACDTQGLHPSDIMHRTLMAANWRTARTTFA